MKTLFALFAVALSLMWLLARIWVPLDKAPALFCVDELKDANTFVTRLQEAADPVSQYLRSVFPEELNGLIEAYVPGSEPSPAMRKQLIYALNDVLEGPPVYDKDRFRDVSLSPATRELVEDSPFGAKLVFLNRHLLEDAYPASLAKVSEKPPVTTLSWTTDPNPARQAQLAPLHATHCDLGIKVEPNAYDKIIIQCSSGVGPDLIEIYDKTQMVGYAEAGILMDLTPYAKEYGFSPDVTFSQLRGNIVIDGRQYRFPCNIGNQVLIYNKELFQKAGIPEPTDDMEWGEFIDLVKPLTVERPDGHGYEQFAMLVDVNYVKDIHLQFGGRFYTDDKTACALDEPVSIAAVEFYYDLIKKHRVVPSATEARALASAGGWGTNEIRWFASGRAAVLWGARWMMVQFRQYPDLNGKLGNAFLPHAEGRPTACYCGTRGTGININSPSGMKALEFMKYLASDEYNRTIGLGSDGLPPNAEFARNPDNLLNPKYPWETREFHKKFVDAMEYASSPDISPFVDPVIVNTIWLEALDEVTNDLKTPEQAMRDAAKRVNDRIDQNVRDRPDLKALYDKIKRGEDRPAPIEKLPPPTSL